MPARSDQAPVVTSPSFSKVVVVPLTGKLVFVSGHVARDPDGAVLHHNDLRAQATYVFGQIDKVLSQVGGSLRDVVKLTAFLTDMSKYAEYASARADAFGSPYPASSAVGVASLIKAGLLVEVEAIAMITAKTSPLPDRTAKNIV